MSERVSPGALHTPPGSRPEGRAVVLALALAAASVALGLREAWTTDDALLSYRYADNLVRGAGLVFNEGERVEAFSSPLFLLVLAAGRALGADPFALSHALGLAATAIEAALLAVLTRRVTGRLWPAALCGGLFATDRIVTVWSTGGLETATFGALVTTALFLSVTCSARSSGVVRLAAVHVAMAAVRPEGALLYGLHAAWLAFTAQGTARARVVRSLNVFVPAVALLVLARFLYYGELLPNVYRAKVAHVPTWDMGLLYLAAFARRLGLSPGVHLLVWLGLGASLLGRRPVTVPATGAARPRGDEAPARMLGAAYVVSGAALALAMGGDYMTDFRFFRPYMGPLYFTVAAALASLPARTGARRSLPGALAAALVASHIARQVDPTPIAADAPPPARHKEILSETAASAARFREALFLLAEPGDSLLADRSGVKGLGHTLRTVDATGLVSSPIEPDFIPRDDFTDGGPVRERLPGHARWPSVAFLQRERFTFVFPKINRRPPEDPEIDARAPRRQQGYPFLHVTVPLGGGEHLRFFTTLGAAEIEARAAKKGVPLCHRAPWGPLRCAGAPAAP